MRQLFWLGNAMTTNVPPKIDSVCQFMTIDHCKNHGQVLVCHDGKARFIFVLTVTEHAEFASVKMLSESVVAPYL